MAPSVILPLSLRSPSIGTGRPSSVPWAPPLNTTPWLDPPPPAHPLALAPPKPCPVGRDVHWALVLGHVWLSPLLPEHSWASVGETSEARAGPFGVNGRAGERPLLSSTGPCGSLQGYRLCYCVWTKGTQLTVVSSGIVLLSEHPPLSSGFSACVASDREGKVC